jgi:flagellar protein FliO/FliZ
MLLRLAVSLGVVVGIMYLAARLARQRGALGPSGGHRRAALRVVARQSLGKSSSVAVVNLGDRNLVIGVTPQKVTLLAEVDASEVEETFDTQESSGIHWTDPSAGSFPGTARTGIVGQLRELTVRRR